MLKLLSLTALVAFAVGAEINPVYNFSVAPSVWAMAVSNYGGHHRLFCLDETGFSVYTDRSGTFLPLSGGQVALNDLYWVSDLVSGTLHAYQYVAFVSYGYNSRSQEHSNITIIQGYNSVWKIKSQFFLCSGNFEGDIAMSADASVLVVSNASSVLVYSGAGGVYTLAQTLSGTDVQVAAFGIVVLSSDGQLLVAPAVDLYGNVMLVQYTNTGSLFEFDGAFLNNSLYGFDDLKVFHNATTTALLVTADFDQPQVQLYINGVLSVTNNDTTAGGQAVGFAFTPSFNVLQVSERSTFAGLFYSVKGYTVDVADGILNEVSTTGADFHPGQFGGEISIAPMGDLVVAISTLQQINPVFYVVSVTYGDDN